MKVRLEGFLAEKFTPEFNSDKIKSLPEVIRALSANFPDFQKTLSDDKEGFHVIVDDVELPNNSPEELAKVVVEREVWIIPVAAGANGSTFNFIAGAVLIIIGYVVNIYYPGAGTFFIKAGVALMVGGVIQMLAPQPQLPLRPETTSADDPGKFFSGTINTYSQGHSLSVVYGKLRVGCAIISLGKSAEYYPRGAEGGPFGLNGVSGDGVTVPWHWYVEA